jgi:hypothetical protein
MGGGFPISLAAGDGGVLHGRSQLSELTKVLSRMPSDPDDRSVAESLLPETESESESETDGKTIYLRTKGIRTRHVYTLHAH